MSGRENHLQWPCGCVRALFPRLDKTPKLKYLLGARPFSPYKSAVFKKCKKTREWKIIKRINSRCGSVSVTGATATIKPVIIQMMS